jgi:excisionase family DNA binding protein
MASPAHVLPPSVRCRDQRFLMPQTLPVLEPLLDAKSVAALLGVHQNTVLKLTRSGNLPGFRLGRHWRFRRGDIADWVVKRLPDERSADYPSAAAPDRGG